jgi:centromeric protein E
VNILEQRLVSVTGDKSSISSEQSVSEEFTDELKKKIQTQVITCYFSLLDHNSLMD